MTAGLPSRRLKGARMPVRTRDLILAILAGGALCTPAMAEETRERGGDRQAMASRGEFDARRKLRTALQLMEGGEHERAANALRNLLDQYPDSAIRHKVNLEIGRHILERESNVDAAIEHFRRVADIKEGLEEEQELRGDDLDIYLESLYLTGTAHYQVGNYSKLFPVLRQITAEYPNSVWANQAYYYIGMAHFLQRNWGKAIRYLQMVGTFVDPEASTAAYVEAGHRLFIKVEDGDLPIIEDLGGGGAVEITTASGDRAELQLVPLSRSQSVYMATIGTEMGTAIPDDPRLQVIGGDEITVRYLDGNTVSGEANVLREERVQVVSTASAAFTAATFTGTAKSAFIGQPVFAVLTDADLDVGPDAQTVSVVISSQFLDESDDDDGTIDFMAEEDEVSGPQWRVRDEVRIELVELGNVDEEAEEQVEPTVWHTGKFTGQVQIIEAQPGEAIDTGDSRLAAFPSDRITISYLDEMHAGGSYKRTVEAHIPVIGRYRGSFQQVGGDLEDSVDTARKSVIEGEAYYRLAEIFNDMGLKDGAGDQVAEGMARVDGVITSAEEIPDDLRQQAFRLRWQMQILTDDLPGAIATCQAFNQAFPDSRFADEALLDIGRALLDMEEFEQAREVFNSILGLTESDAMAEAQYLIAQSIEVEGEALEPAIPAYQMVAQRFPQSQYAGEALGKLVQYHIESGDFVAANDMLEQIFEEHPDKEWLDGMLVRWVVMAYRMRDYQLAYDKAQQLIMEYPQSDHASRIRGMLDKIRQRMDAAQSAAP